MTKKSTVITIGILAGGAFLFLVYYAYRHARGVPVVPEEIPRPTLGVHFSDKKIDLAQGLSKKIWEKIPALEIELVHQLMVLPWPGALSGPLAVRAFHNGKEIYFYLSWPDAKLSEHTGRAVFPDACAALFPLSSDPQPSSLMMGFLGKANIWHWKASANLEYWGKAEPSGEKAYSDYHYPFEEKEIFPVSREKINSAASDLVAIRVGTITKKDKQEVMARGFYTSGRWEVVFSRSLGIAAIDKDNAVLLGPGTKIPVAFAVWNGEKGDRGGRKSISDWVDLVIN